MRVTTSMECIELTKKIWKKLLKNIMQVKTLQNSHARSTNSSF